jgi:heptosyltransferase-3
MSAEVLNGSGLIHGTMNYPVRVRDARRLLALRREIRAFRPDALVYLGPIRGVRAAKRDALFFRLCGIKKIYGLPDTEDMQRCRQLPEVVGFVRPETPWPQASPDIGLTVEDLREPEASRLARCLAELGDAKISDPASWDLRLTDAEKNRATELLAVEKNVGVPSLRQAQGRLGSDSASAEASTFEASTFSAVHGFSRAEQGQVERGALAPEGMILAAAIGTKVQSKDWGVANWTALLTQLAVEFPGHRLVLVGAAQEAEQSAQAAAAWGARALNLCGELTPRETAAVLAHAQLFIGLDSGPMHLAACVATPIVAIFAARNRPVHWFPFGMQHRVVYHRTDCWGCALETCIAQKKKCLTSITVEEVLAAIHKSLAARQA